MHQLDFNTWWPTLTIILSNEKKLFAIEWLNLNAWQLKKLQQENGQSNVRWMSQDHNFFWL
jgi:hypothetical protein